MLMTIPDRSSLIGPASMFAIPLSQWKTPKISVDVAGFVVEDVDIRNLSLELARQEQFVN